ncbi:MAG TPA: short-chain dehydrogenase/reductase, partial [Cupriavidus sp.]|nr:short-chain dehydrogenase/reductase [Cupriavidus sp.]
ARPKTRYAVGFGARPMIVMRRLLSDRAFDSLMRMAARMPHRAQRRSCGAAS